MQRPLSDGRGSVLPYLLGVKGDVQRPRLCSLSACVRVCVPVCVRVCVPVCVRVVLRTDSAPASSLARGCKARLPAS